MATTKQKTAHCRVCQRQVLGVGTKPNHLLHFFLTVFSFGMWIFIWILVTLAMTGGYRCQTCGTVV